ncbi:hypothetical protein Tco_0950010 [Tanacetum coccineum]
MKDLGEASYILGIKIYIDRSRRLIGLCQSAYIEKNLKRFNMENSKRGLVPMQERPRLSEAQGSSTPDDVKRIQRELRVTYYIDVGYLTNANDSKSQTRYVFVLNGGVVDWKSVKQSIIATSSIKAEYMVASEASKEVVWIWKFIYGLSVVPTNEEPMKMHYDNIGAITIANEPGITKCAKHYHTKVHYLRKVIELGDIILAKFHTNDNVDDPFTKFISRLGVVPTNEEPMKMYCDNTISITIANEPRIIKGAKHYRTKVHYLREVIKLVDIILDKAHIYDNVDDPFTKVLPFNKHYDHTKSIGLLPASSLM